MDDPGADVVVNNLPGRRQVTFGLDADALQESFRTADDRWVVLFMPEPRWWEKFCTAAGRPE